MILNTDLTGEMRLGSSHALIIGHKPNNLEYKKLCDKISGERKSLMQFGLFDTASPNYSTYYPDLDVEDLKPKDGEFIFPVFRALSKTIVSKYFPIDFSHKNVLKKSMNKLVGQSINIDHETAVGNAIGSVKEVFWQEAYKTSDNIEVPAGINFVMMIDGKSNPRIARGIMMEPPSIHSNSVSIRFKWVPSHNYEEKNEFFEKIGQYDDDGVLIRAIVSEIMSYPETSLVAHGADVFAQKIGEDGKIINPGYADSVYQFSADQTKVFNIAHIDYKELNIISEKFNIKETIPIHLNIKDDLKNKQNNKNELNMDKEQLKKLALELGFKTGELTEENLTEKITGKVSNLETEKSNLQTEVDDLTNSKTEPLISLQDLAVVKAEAVIGKSALSERITEALRLYKLCKADKADDNIINLINTSNYETANSFLEQYKTEATEKFQSTCKKCGTVVSMSSGIGSQENLVDADGNPIEGQNEKIILGKNETLKKFREKRNQSRIFTKTK